MATKAAVEASTSVTTAKQVGSKDGGVKDNAVRSARMGGEERRALLTSPYL
jgi:hypothetical protein